MSHNDFLRQHVQPSINSSL